MLKAFLRTAVEIVDRRVVSHYAGQYFEIGDPSGEGVSHRLEGEQGSRLRCGDVALNRVSLVVRRGVAHCLSAKRRRRENLDQEVQNRIAADIVKGRAEQDRKDLLVPNFFVQPLFQVLDRKCAL